MSEENEFGMGRGVCMRSEDSREAIRLVEVSYLAFLLSIVLASLRILPSVGQDNFVTAARRKLGPQGTLEEGDIHSIREDERMLPWPSKLFRYFKSAHVSHGRSPSANNCRPSCVKGCCR